MSLQTVQRCSSSFSRAQYLDSQGNGRNGPETSDQMRFFSCTRPSGDFKLHYIYLVAEGTFAYMQHLQSLHRIICHRAKTSMKNLAAGLVLSVLWRTLPLERQGQSVSYCVGHTAFQLVWGLTDVWFLVPKTPQSKDSPGLGSFRLNGAKCRGKSSCLAMSLVSRTICQYIIFRNWDCTAPCSWWRAGDLQIYCTFIPA